MDQTLALGWTRRQAAARRIRYQWVLGVNLGLYVLLALFALIAPTAFSRLFGLPLPVPSAWLRAWAGLLIMLSLLYLPALLSPLRWRWGNVIGIVGRFGMAIIYLFLGGGFLWFALFDIAFAVALFILYLRLATAELMSRP